MGRKGEEEGRPFSVPSDFQLQNRSLSSHSPKGLLRFRDYFRLPGQTLNTVLGSSALEVATLAPASASAPTLGLAPFHLTDGRGNPVPGSGSCVQHCTASSAPVHGTRAPRTPSSPPAESTPTYRCTALPSYTFTFPSQGNRLSTTISNVNTATLTLFSFY